MKTDFCSVHHFASVPFSLKRHFCSKSKKTFDRSEIKATINAHGFKNYFSDSCLRKAGGQNTGTLGNVLIKFISVTSLLVTDVRNEMFW